MTTKAEEDLLANSNEQSSANKNGTTKDKENTLDNISTSNDTSALSKERSSARWAILRNAIVKSTSQSTTKTAQEIGSIHRFAGFNLLRRERLPRTKVPFWRTLLTSITVNNNSNNQEKDLVDALELSLLALTALRPAEWVWEFTIISCQLHLLDRQAVLDLLEQRLLQSNSDNPKQKIRLGKGSTWLDDVAGTEKDQKVLKIVLAPFVPSYGIFCYQLPAFDADGNRKDDGKNSNDDEPSFLITRERLETTRTSLQELVSHHHHAGIDNTGNVCVWDSEKTMSYCLLKHLALQNLPWLSSNNNGRNEEPASVDILELGAGMAGLAGLSLAQTLRQQDPTRQFRLWLTDGHPQAVQNNQVHAHLMHLQHQLSDGANPITCVTLPWSMDPPSSSAATTTQPPPCHITLVSDCTHFQEYHAHLFFTLAYGVRVNGCIYMCQPHRGKSLERFLNVVEATSVDQDEGSIERRPLFSVEKLEIPELSELNNDATASYDPNIHCPQWLMLRKLREVQERDRSLVLKHMATRDGALK